MSTLRASVKIFKNDFDPGKFIADLPEKVWNFVVVQS